MSVMVEIVGRENRAFYNLVLLVSSWFLDLLAALAHTASCVGYPSRSFQGGAGAVYPGVRRRTHGYTAKWARRVARSC